MTKQLYTITKDDCLFAHECVSKKITEYGFLDYLEYEQKQAALNEYSATKMWCAHKKLHVSCETYLNEGAWEKLKCAIRQKRRRLKLNASIDDKPVSINLTPSAHSKLKRVADADGVTLSQAIEKYFAKPYYKALGSDKGLQEDLL